MNPQGLEGTEQTAAARPSQTRRRRPTTGPAQEKRKAWGREHGAFYAELKRKRKESER